jgi:hypothetical protein
MAARRVPKTGAEEATKYDFTASQPALIFLTRTTSIRKLIRDYQSRDGDSAILRAIGGGTTCFDGVNRLRSG